MGLLERDQSKPNERKKRWHKYYKILCLLDQVKTTYSLTLELGMECRDSWRVKKILETMEDMHLVWRKTFVGKNGSPVHYWAISLLGIRDRDQYKKAVYRRNRA